MYHIIPALTTMLTRAFGLLPGVHLVSQLAAQKRARLQAIVAERAAWASQLAQVKRWMRGANRWPSCWPRARFPTWSRSVGAECLQVLFNLRPYVVQCYDRKDFPRTAYPGMERSIRALKTQFSTR